MRYYGQLNESLYKSQSVEDMEDWLLANFGNPAVLNREDIPLLAPLEALDRHAYKVAVSTARHESPMIIYDSDRPLTTRQQAQGDE